MDDDLDDDARSVQVDDTSPATKARRDLRKDTFDKTAAKLADAEADYKAAQAQMHASGPAPRPKSVRVKVLDKRLPIYHYLNINLYHEPITENQILLKDSC